MWQLSHQQGFFFKNLLILVSFCIATLILEMGGKKQPFWHNYALFRKAKTQLKLKRRFTQRMENVECAMTIKSGLQNFVLEISHQTILHSWVDQLKLTAIKSGHELRKGNSWHTKNIQIKHWKLFCTSLVTLIALMFGFHTSE